MGGGKAGRLRDELWAEGHQATLFHGKLAQAKRQRGKLTPDWNVGLANAIFWLKEKAEKMVRE